MLTPFYRGRIILRSIFKIVALVLSLSGYLTEALGQDPAPPRRVESIVITGNRRIPSSTILYYIQSKENDPYNEQQVLRDYRNLLNTNFFSDARVLIREGETGIIIIFEVTEKPLVRAIEYRGMKSFKESDVLEKFRDMKVGLTVDSPFDEAKIPLARKALRLLLELNGRPLGKVEVRTEPITSSSIKLVFEIDEGRKVRIGTIDFEGNTVLSAAALKDSLQLNKERGPISLFKGQDKFVPDKLEYDVQVNLLAKYREKGYIMAKAGQPNAEIVEAPRGMLFGFRKTRQQYLITVPIEEGQQFKVGSFNLAGVNTFNQEVVRRGYDVTPGQVVNYTRLKESTDKLKELYSTLGFLDMDAGPEINPHPDTQTVDITINVNEGKRYLVDQINFSGNTKTRDKVLRREFLIEEKSEFNGQLLDISIRRLNQLGFFEKIEEKDYEVIKRPDEGEVDVLVKVKEKSQQSIGVTGGVSGYSGGFFGVNYQTNNFRGRGESIDVQAMAGTRSASFLVGYQRPYFLDTRWSVGANVFSQRYQFDTYTAYYGLISPEDNTTLYTHRSTGFTFTGSYPLGRWTRAGISYSLQRIKIDDIADSFKDYALNQLVGFTPGGSIEDAQEGIIRSEVSPSYVYNSKNSYFQATEGSQLLVELPIIGGPFGGDLSMIRPSVEYQHFMPDRWLSGRRNSLAFRLRMAHLMPFGTLPSGDAMQAPFFERFFSGGEYSIRGFDIRSVSPYAITRAPRLDNAGNVVIDPASGLPNISEGLIPVGGDTSFLATGEYRFPIVGPLTAAAFVDLGTSVVLREGNLQLFGPDTSIELIDGTNKVMRMSTGLEIQFLLPVINQPFRLIWAYNPLRLNTEATYQGVTLPMREDAQKFTFSVGYSF